MPSLLLGRSRMCPIDASTVKLLSRNFEMVFAFVGDSTMTSLPCLTAETPALPEGSLAEAGVFRVGFEDVAAPGFFDDIFNKEERECLRDDLIV